ncbi:MAG TPA: hypothetical protein PK990_06970 [Salinivirgaceae bacterium]|nr:hypothetical protein [Salinivirgaceae bacterium]
MEVVNESLKELAEGNLQVKISDDLLNRPDELGQLATSVRQLSNQSQQLAESISFFRNARSISKSKTTYSINIQTKSLEKSLKSWP